MATNKKFDFRVFHTGRWLCFQQQQESEESKKRAPIGTRGKKKEGKRKQERI